MDELKDRVRLDGGDILSSGRFLRAERIVHHKNTNLASHSMKTAEYAVRICRFMNRHGLQVNEKDAVRACLLHDIGMTVEEVHKSISFKKAYLHPRRGAQIARKEYYANEVQTNAILRHMWPICIIPPVHTVGWVVVAADKCSSAWEITHRRA